MGFFEISKRNSKGGKRKIKLSLLEIHKDKSATNDNGIHWNEEYVTNALGSLKMMPICVEFTDEEKRIPLGHGLTGIDTDINEPVFTDSEVVGAVENGYISTVEINGKDTDVLIGEGYIYQQRYPNFVEWLSENVPNGNVMSSIEITGTPENGNKIVYSGEPTDDWREPEEFLFSGTAILSIEAGDKKAVVLQLNSLNDKSKTKESEGKEEMDENTINIITDAVKNAVAEVSSKNSEYEKTISELNELVAAKEAKIVELNASVETIQAALDQLKSDQETMWAERDILEKELAAAKVKERISEMESALAGFTDEQKAYASAEIEAFNNEPTSVEINSIVEKIYVGIGKKALEDAKVSEINSAKEAENNDILGEVVVPKETEDTVDIYAPVY